ncbi:MAG: hypothetical protein VX642_13815, partial [Bdellovibrionota bacterium]|nr:hypothetical protein [Bdellovibrionota bacterium]
MRLKNQIKTWHDDCLYKSVKGESILGKIAQPIRGIYSHLNISGGYMKSAVLFANTGVLDFLELRTSIVRIPEV